MAKFNELYQGSMVAVGKKDDIYFFKFNVIDFPCHFPTAREH